MRNHGDNNSNDWRESMSYAKISNGVLAFTKKMNFNKVILIGYSMVGTVTKMLPLSRPDRTSSLVVPDIAPACYGAEKDNSWNGACELTHSLKDIIAF